MRPPRLLEQLWRADHRQLHERLQRSRLNRGAKRCPLHHCQRRETVGSPGGTRTTPSIMCRFLSLDGLCFSAARSRRRGVNGRGLGIGVQHLAAVRLRPVVQWPGHRNRLAQRHRRTECPAGGVVQLLQCQPAASQHGLYRPGIQVHRRAARAPTARHGRSGQRRQPARAFAVAGSQETAGQADTAAIADLAADSTLSSEPGLTGGTLDAAHECSC